MALSEKESHAFQTFEKNGWEDAASPYHRHWGNLSSQSAEPMLDAAQVAKGSRVLDAATGAGYIAAAAKQRGADAVGIDFSAAQVSLAQKTYPDITFQRASVEALPFEADSFDAVLMGFGMNHLPDPEAAFHEAYRVLKSGGWFAFTVWAAPRPGEAFGIVLSALEELGAKSVQLPPAPPYFRFADPVEVEKVFRDTGFLHGTTRIVPQYWRHQSPDSLFDAFNEGAVRATAMLRAQPEEAREAIRVASRKEVEKLKRDGVYVVPGPAALSFAQKP